MSNSKRILGDQRIFQSIVNDLKLEHELIVEHKENSIKKRYVYFYDGTDPYELEDEHFPSITKAIALAKLDGAIEENRQHLSSINSSPDVNNDILSMPFNYRLAELKAQRQTLLGGEE